MLTTIKGYYDHGQIILKEKPPVPDKTDVIVTFLTDDKKEREAGKRILGALTGKIAIPDNFNDDLEDFYEA